MASRHRSLLLPKGLKLVHRRQQSNDEDADMSTLSVAPLLHLANFPQVPNAFSNTVGDHKDLVLYIVQLPERLDFLLTFHKPQAKYTTSVDVQNALYVITSDAEKPPQSKVMRKPVAAGHFLRTGNVVLTLHRRRGYAVDLEPVGQATVHSSSFQSDKDQRQREQAATADLPPVTLELYGEGYRQFMSSVTLKCYQLEDAKSNTMLDRRAPTAEFLKSANTKTNNYKR